MRNKGKRGIAILLCLILLFCSTGCHSDITNATGCLELSTAPLTALNDIWYNTGGFFYCAVFESLVATEADMQTIKPALAEEYYGAEDGLSYEFVLREDVLWHDGEKLDTDDVIFSMKSLLRMKEVSGLLSTAFQYIEGAEAYKNGETEELAGVTAEGNRIRIRLESPMGSFLNAMAQFAILPQHVLGETAPDSFESHAFWKYPVGCGPYQVAEAVEGEYFLLQRNPSYYGSKPGIENMRIWLAVEDSVTAMEEGSLDFCVTNDPEEVAKLKGISNCSAHRLNILFPAYLIVNLSGDAGTHPDLHKVLVRKALLKAIDRETLIDIIFPGSSVSDTMVPSWDSWYWGEGESYTFDPEEAKRLLEEAGFDFSQTIRLRYFTKGQSTADLMRAIAVYWQNIGIKVELDMFENSGSEHMFRIRDYDICYKRLSAFNHAAIYEEMAGAGVMQTSIYNQPVYDEKLAILETALEEEKRKEIVGQLQELDQEHLLRLPLFALVSVAYVNDSRLELPEVYGNLWYRYNLRFDEWRLKD